ncbi:MAG: glycosyltransferase family 2 protein [Methanobacterium sp.]|uniref:glycosyltransferase family 2 protein n=1 Tax=Methanobacterium sp. TaxID=2164 RepID=UPI003D64A9EA|nr:glycosyltransferase family 2 protein [Methanobacterium sp.]
MNPHVSIIILNWNGWKDTIGCLESLYQIDYPNYNVILVDNNSKDDSIEKIKEYCKGKLTVESPFFKYDSVNKPINILKFTNNELNTKDGLFQLPSNRKLILIENDENYGFAEGNNIGIKYSLENLNTDFVLLLNNDTMVEPQFLNILVNEADNENIGILGPNVYYYSEPDKITYIGGDINCYTGKITHPHLNTTKNNLKNREIDYICGCSLLIKKKVINEVGLLDPQYFIYYEDTDWCLRAKNKGFKVIYVPEAKIWHKISSSINKDSTMALYYGIRNHFLLIRKNCDFKHLLIFLPVFLFRKFIFSLFLIFQGRINEFKTVIYAVIDAINGKYGFKDLD